MPRMAASLHTSSSSEIWEIQSSLSLNGEFKTINVSAHTVHAIFCATTHTNTSQHQQNKHQYPPQHHNNSNTHNLMRCATEFRRSFSGVGTSSSVYGTSLSGSRGHRLASAIANRVALLSESNRKTLKLTNLREIVMEIVASFRTN